LIYYTKILLWDAAFDIQGSIIQTIHHLHHTLRIPNAITQPPLCRTEWFLVTHRVTLLNYTL